jgi:hypothetical protein
VERVGGREITKADSEQLATDFDMPNLQFGVGVAKSDKDSKSHIIGAHGALFDLADMLGVDPKNIGLRHRLSLGIASRGHGPFRAHYEAEGTIINITRVAGGGSLAHEWAHALDNIASVAADPSDTSARNRFITAGRTRNLSPEANDAWGAVMDAITYGAGVTKTTTGQASRLRSNFWHDGAAIGGGGADCYWTRPHELFARAFESYIEDKLQANGRKSSYLATGTQKYYKTGNHSGRIPEGERNETNYAQPYPQGEERTRINAAMERLVEVLRKEQTLEKAMAILDDLAKARGVPETPEQAERKEIQKETKHPPRMPLPGVLNRSAEYYTGKNGGKWTAKGSGRPWRETWEDYEDGLKKFRDSWPEGKELNRFEAEHKAADKRKLLELKKRAEIAKAGGHGTGTAPDPWPAKINNPLLNTNPPRLVPEKEQKKIVSRIRREPKRAPLKGIMHRGGIADLDDFAKSGKV